MDQSFNDKELSDIMKEIEALEQDFTAGPEKKVSPVMEQLTELDEEKAIPTSSTENVLSWEAKKEESIVDMEPENSSWEPTPMRENTSSMSFKVQGNLTLDMRFEIGGKIVNLEVTESGLTIELQGGMKFSVPVDEEYKKAV